jgi:hypothetical protein
MEIQDIIEELQEAAVVEPAEEAEEVLMEVQEELMIYQDLV